MKDKIIRALSIIVATFSLGSIAMGTVAVYADDENSESTNALGTSIGLSPVSKVLEISSNSSYDDKVEIKNEGDEQMEVEVYASPYSYTYSEEENVYKLGFNNENNYTQIARWITFKDNDGNWKQKATYKIKPHEAFEVEYKITTPDNIPAGGQYAVIFAHTLTAVTSANGIKTEASPGMIMFGRSTEGEAVIKTTISDVKLEESVTENGTTRNNFHASARVKNDGNVDFMAKGVLKVEPIIGGSSYETPDNKGKASIIPETELAVYDEWEDSPSFGLYKVTWTVTAGEETEVIEKMVFINPLPLIIILIILLTIGIVGAIMVVRKRKERRSRLAV